MRNKNLFQSVKFNWWQLPKVYFISTREKTLYSPAPKPGSFNRNPFRDKWCFMPFAAIGDGSRSQRGSSFHGQFNLRPPFRWFWTSAPLVFLAVALTYVFAAWVGLQLGNTDAKADVIWPANGFLLGILLVTPRKQWPAYLLSPILSSLITHGPFNFPLGKSMLFSVADVAEVLVGATLVLNFKDGRPDLSRFASLIRFFLYGVIVAPLASSLLVGLCEVPMGLKPDFVGLRDWYVGDALGVVIVTPLVLAIHGREVLKLLQTGKRGETALLLSVMLGLSYLIFRECKYPVAFILFPILLLITFRLGTTGGAIGIVLMSAPAAYFTVIRRGPFSLTLSDPLIYNILILQLFLSVLTVTVYVVGAALAENQRLHDSLTGSYRQLAAKEESLRHLSGQLLQAQDEERRRIARDLHDSVSQIHALALLNLSKVSTQTLGEFERAALAESKSLLEAATREVRAVSYLLHPPLLDELGLASALNSYIKGFAQRTGIAIQLDLDSDLAHLEGELELTLFRVVQESLTNILRHSGSPAAQIRIHIDHSLVLEIEDYGRGFSIGDTSEHRGIDQLGVGIAGMRERIRQFGGMLELLSANPGMIVRVTIPGVGRGSS